MSDIADKIYAATGLTLNAEAAAKVGHMIRLTRQEAADEIEKLRAERDALQEALRTAKDLYLHGSTTSAFIEICAALGEKE
jgi:hypothetical protein